MSKHSKHKHHHHKDHKAEKGPEAVSHKPDESSATLAAPEAMTEEDTQSDDKSSEGIFENVAKLNGKKQGGHEPVSFIPPNPPMDHSAQASLDAHKAAEEDKDPADVQQELTHKEILAGVLDPSSPDAITKDLPDDGKNKDAAVAEDAPAAPLDAPAPASDEENAGQETKESAPADLTQPSTDGSPVVDGTEADAGATPSAS